MNDDRCEKTMSPHGWQRCVLPDFTCIVMGQSPASKTYNHSGAGLPFFQGKAEFGDLYPTINMYCSQPKKIAKQGATLLSVRAPVGPTNLAQHKCCIGRGLAALHPCGEIEPKFLLYLFRSIEPVISGKGTGSTFKSITKGFVEDLEFDLPPLLEQHRIVARIEELFSELDKGIESLKTARRQLEVYRQSVLKHAFEGKLTAQWRKENKDKIETVEQLIERIPIPVQPRGGRAASADVIEGGAAMAVNIPVKAPPAGWSWVSLLRVARQETGHTPSRKHPEYWDGDQFWIGIADARLHHGKEIENTIQKVTPKGLDNSSARTLPSKTVCLSRTASVGYVCIMARPMATSQDFATWTCTEALEPKFLMYALMAEGNEIRRFGKGTTHTTIYFPEIRAMTICLPPLEEQRAIIDAVEAKLQQLDALAADIDSSLAHCDVLRRSILKKAFAGQLVAQNPNDEPASVLLDRIKVEKEQASKSREITKRTRKKRTVA